MTLEQVDEISGKSWVNGEQGICSLGRGFIAKCRGQKVYYWYVVQKMVRSDLAASGVMFSIDTETGFKNAALITAAYGLGENVVQGAVNPDEYFVFKPTLKQGYRPILEKRLQQRNQNGLRYRRHEADEERSSAGVRTKETMSLNPDSVMKTLLMVAEVEGVKS